ncbi:hypothetical protein BH11PLA1_BH11PLA1_05550 [soil metagenome]
MHFDLIDTVLEQSPTSITTIKQVSRAEEYLQDHFADFPVLPGVLMLEAMVHAARRLLETNDQCSGASPRRYVLGAVRALKYGAFVRPGFALRVRVEIFKSDTAAGATEFKGSAELIGPIGAPSAPNAQSAAEPEIAAAGRFTLRPVRLDVPESPPALVAS